jgi:hypothetical protein
MTAAQCRIGHPDMWGKSIAVTAQSGDRSCDPYFILKSLRLVRVHGADANWRVIERSCVGQLMSPSLLPTRRAVVPSSSQPRWATTNKVARL